jgi:hypothetical protein
MAKRKNQESNYQFEGLGSQDIKSMELTRFPYMQATCDIPLESFRQVLQLYFKPHYNQRFAREVMRPQSRGSPSRGNFGSPTWESWDKKPFGCGPMEKCIIYYKGEGGGFPQVQGMVNLVCLNCPWFILAPKVPQLCTNHFVLVLCKSV